MYPDIRENFTGVCFTAEAQEEEEDEEGAQDPEVEEEEVDAHREYLKEVRAFRKQLLEQFGQNGSQGNVTLHNLIRIQLSAENLHTGHVLLFQFVMS